MLTFVNSYADGAEVFRQFLASPAYRRAVEQGRAAAFGISPGEFDLDSLTDKSKPAFPDLRNLNPSGSLRADDLAPAPDKARALAAALEILEKHVAATRAAGKDPTPVAAGALSNALKFVDELPSEMRTAVLDSHDRIFGEERR